MARPEASARVRWSAPLESWPMGVVRVGDALIATVAGPPLFTARAFSLDGQPRWATEFGGTKLCGVDDGVVCDGPTVVRLSAATGRVETSRVFEADAVARPVSDRGPVLAIGSPDGPVLALYVVHPQTLEPLWTATDPHRTAVHGDFACRLGGDSIEITELTSGTTWTQGLSLHGGLHHHFGRWVCHFRFDGGRDAFDMADGSHVWHFEEESGWNGSRAVAEAGGRVFAHTSKGLSCYDLASGRVVWRVSTPDGAFVGIERSLVVMNEVLWCATSTAIYRLRAADGEVTGRYLLKGDSVGFSVPLDAHRIVITLSASLRCVEMA